MESVAYALNFLVDVDQFLVSRVERGLERGLLLLLLLDCKFHCGLLLAALFELGLLLQQLLLLLHCGLHGFITAEQLFLHLVEAFERLSGLLFLLLLGLLFSLHLSHELLFLLLAHFSLGFDLCFLLFEFFTDILLILLNLHLHLLHLLLILHVRDLLAIHHRDAILTYLWRGALSKVELPAGEGGQLVTQFGDLVVELANHGVFRVLVDTGLILDVLCSGGVPQRGQSLIQIVIGGSHVRNHDCFGVATKTILQYAGQLGVAIRDVRAFRIREGRDNMAQRGERQVNLRRFFEAVTGSASLRLTFATGQIDNVKLADLDLGLSRIFVEFLTLDRNREDRVTPGRLIVHVSCANVSVDGTIVEELHEVTGGLNHESVQVLDVHTCIFVFEFKTAGIFLCKQVADFLIVDLQITGAHEVFSVLLALDLIENVLERTRQDSLQHRVLRQSTNSERLASSRLPVREDRPVVSLHHVGAHRVCCFRENVLLLTVLIVDRIKSERLGHAVAHFGHLDFSTLVLHIDNTKEYESEGLVLTLDENLLFLESRGAGTGWRPGYTRTSFPF